MTPQSAPHVTTNMTYQEFEEKIKKEDASEKYGGYFTAILLLGMGFFIMYQLTFTNWYAEKQGTEENTASLWVLYIPPISLLLMGLYGFWRMPQYYKVTAIDSQKPVPEKKQIFDRIKADFKLSVFSETENYGHYSYAKRFGVQFGIYLLLTENGFYLNVQRINTGIGITDFGSSKRATNYVKNKLVSYL